MQRLVPEKSSLVVDKTEEQQGERVAAARLILFSATAFLSAFLLFALQPLFAKMVLPVLGGSSSVWAVALLFFQAALLAGYAYAHLLTSGVRFGITGFVHSTVAIVAALALPIGLPDGWREPPPTDPYLWQLGLFTVAIGLPFVAIAANAPLLQAWFSRSGEPNVRDPYFLYAASNLGSLAALLSYPFLLEPAFGLSALSIYWSILYGVLIVMLSCCFWIVRGRTSSPAPPVDAAADDARHTTAPTLLVRLGWCGLAMIPAALLTAFTTHIATDIASAPLLWVLPLAIYLATFVLGFQERLPVPMRILHPMQLAAVLLALLELSQRQEDWVQRGAVGVTAFFLSALVAHRTLYLKRPRARELTTFYLWMSLGGVLGGLFAALISPKIFAEVFEYPLLIALAIACRPGAFAVRNRDFVWIAGIVAGGMLLILFGPLAATSLGLSFGDWGATPVITLVFAVLAVAFWRHALRQLTAALMMFATLCILPSSVHFGGAQRSYFGVYRVRQSTDGTYNLLWHGTTLHGSQRIRDADGNSITDTTPGTYYYPQSPLARAVRAVQTGLAAKGTKGRFGIVGLGAGSLACFAKPGEEWRFFEIDPIVVKIAENPNNFTFLANCLPKPDIVIGDARLMLAKEPDKSFDFIIIDAFTSDAVPVHTMTAEALRLYASKLKNGGAVALHISNRHLDLESVLRATLPLVPQLKGMMVNDSEADDTYEQNNSVIAVFAGSEADLAPFRTLSGARSFGQGRVSPWTDDASDILGPLLSKWQ